MCVCVWVGERVRDQADQQQEVKVAGQRNIDSKHEARLELHLLLTLLLRPTAVSVCAPELRRFAAPALRPVRPSPPDRFKHGVSGPQSGLVWIVRIYSVRYLKVRPSHLKLSSLQIEVSILY